MTAKIIIYGRLPSLNEYIAAERQHRQKAAKMKKDCEQFVIEQIGSTQGTTLDNVRMTYRWFEQNRKRDLDNVSSFGRKVIQDALVQIGLLPNDGWKNIKGFSDEFYVDKENPRIEIEITELA